jgi:hypothetical protein
MLTDQARDAPGATYLADESLGLHLIDETPDFAIGKQIGCPSSNSAH